MQLFVGIFLQTLLLSDTSSDDEDDDDEPTVTEAELSQMLKEHVRAKRYRKRFARDKDVSDRHLSLLLLIEDAINEFQGFCSAIVV